MSELSQVMSELRELKKGHEEILTAIKGNESMGQKGFVHRIANVEKISYENRDELKQIRIIRNYSEKRIALITGIVSTVSVGIIELALKLIK